MRVEGGVEPVAGRMTAPQRTGEQRKISDSRFRKAMLAKPGALWIAVLMALGNKFSGDWGYRTGTVRSHKPKRKDSSRNMQSLGLG